MDWETDALWKEITAIGDELTVLYRDKERNEARITELQQRSAL